MPVTRTVGLSLGAAILLCGSAFTIAQAKPFMIVGCDEKVLWDDDGKTILSAAGNDHVLIVALANPQSPKIIATLPLKSSSVGPPVNLDIDPTNSVALAANAVASACGNSFGSTRYRRDSPIVFIARAVAPMLPGWDTCCSIAL